MRKKIRWILNCILVLILLFASVKYVQSVLDNIESQKEYEEAIQFANGPVNDGPEQTKPAEASTEAPENNADSPVPQETTAQIPDDPIIQELLEIDLAALQQENEDVIGWIYVPNSKISYPLLHWTDNKFYLDHTWKQTSNASGAIFMDCQNSKDFSDFNTIIYGHNMNNGSMFAALHHYSRPNYWNEHPYVYILNENGVLRYDVFATQSFATDSIIYGLEIETAQRKEEFIRFARDYSLIETDVVPTAEDRILTLSTCTGGGHTKRRVVLGVLNEEHSYIRPE